MRRVLRWLTKGLLWSIALGMIGLIGTAITLWPTVQNSIELGKSVRASRTG